MLTRLFCSLACVAALAGGASAQDSPTSLSCTSNAKASRDYGFTEKQWSGVIPPDPAKVFGISTVKQRQANFPLRDKVFSSLNTPTPVIRSITPPRPVTGQKEESAEEFKGTVVSRTADAVFVMWSNDFGNKAWLAVVDLRHKKATVSQVFQGLTSVGIEAETLDCK
jgi:hypothetical protein